VVTGRAQLIEVGAEGEVQGPVLGIAQPQPAAGGEVEGILELEAAAAAVEVADDLGNPVQARAHAAGVADAGGRRLGSDDGVEVSTVVVVPDVEDPVADPPVEAATVAGAVGDGPLELIAGRAGEVDKAVDGEGAVPPAVAEQPELGAKPNRALALGPEVDTAGAPGVEAMEVVVGDGDAGFPAVGDAEADAGIEVIPVESRLLAVTDGQEVATLVDPVPVIVIKTERQAVLWDGISPLTALFVSFLSSGCEPWMAETQSASAISYWI
jgi:hypothetical protein